MNAALLITLAALPPFALLTWWRRSAGLALFALLLPTYLVRFSLPLPGIGSLPSTMLEALFWTLFAVWLCMDGTKPGAWRALGEWSVPMTLLAVAAAVSVLVAPDLRASLGLWRAYFLEPMLFFPLFVNVVTRERRGWWVLSALGLLCALIGVTAVYQKFTGFGIPNPIWAAAATRRVTSVFGFPNAIGLLCAPITVLMAGWSLAMAEKPTWRHKLAATMPLKAAAWGVAGIVFAVSEGAMIGAAAGFAALGLFHRRLRAAVLVAVIAGCAMVMAYAPATRYFSGIIGMTDDSTSVRAIIWRETGHMLADAPVFGAGLAGYPARIVPYHAATWIEIFQYPHDLVLNFWSETGLLGLLAFLWILARFFALSWRLGREKAGADNWIVAATAAAMIAVVVHGLVDVPYFKNDLAFLFWILVGITESVRQIRADERDASLLEKAKQFVSGPPPETWRT